MKLTIRLIFLKSLTSALFLLDPLLDRVWYNTCDNCNYHGVYNIIVNI